MVRPEAILFDLDGTLYVGDEAIEGAIETIRHLRQRQYRLRFLTNTTTKTQQALVHHMHKLGFQIHSEELISAPIAAVLELKSLQKNLNRPLRIWPVVADAIKGEFDAFVVDTHKPDYIVLGDIGDRWDLTLINSLFHALHAGAELIALHKNRFWQTQEGLKADIGFFVAGYEYVCNKSARVMGKPNRDFYQRVLNELGVSAESALMVGDDIDTDIGGAQAMGMQACLVKTGKFRQHYFEQSSVKPTVVLDSVAGLADCLN